MTTGPKHQVWLSETCVSRSGSRLVPDPYVFDYHIGFKIPGWVGSTWHCGGLMELDNGSIIRCRREPTDQLIGIQV